MIDYLPNIKNDDLIDPRGRSLNEIDLIPHSFGYQNGFDETIRERMTGDLEVIHFAGGVCEISIGAKKYKCTTGDTILIPPFVRHDIKTVDKLQHENYWIHFNISPASHLQRFLELVIPGNEHKTNIEDPLILKFYKKVYEEAVYKNPGYMSMLKALLRYILTLMARYSSDATAHISSRKADDIVYAAVEYIEKNLYKAPSVTALCEQLNVSSSYLSKCFSDIVGMPPGRYISMKRLKAAERMLLSTSMKLEEIADELGYSSPFYLSSQFKKHYGIPPSKIR